MSFVIVGGIKTANLSRKELTAVMVRDCFAARGGSLVYPRVVIASNGSVIARYHADPLFRVRVEEADIIDADGMPLVLASRLLCRRTPLVERIATTDFVHDAAAAAAAAGIRFYFLGGTPSVAESAARKLVERHPGLQVAGVRHGYFAAEDEGAICADVLTSAADVLWIGMGSPRQEELALRLRGKLPGVAWIRTCGGLFDHVSGSVPRAPGWMQDAGLEWLHRMMIEPRRLGWRYLTTNPVACFHLLTKTTDRIEEWSITARRPDPDRGVRLSHARKIGNEAVKVTVGIKSLNEERHIAAAIESALGAIDGLDGEVVLADSGSTDGTVEIARRYPIRIVQLASVAERCCGAGAELAYRHARAEYFYLLDGDMVMQPGFLAAAVAYLDAHPEVAAVGGVVREMNTEAAEFEIRARAVERESGWLSGPVDRLDCGGLYRSAAIRELGWFADRNLHAFEEFELGARLRTRGWRLVRLDIPAVDHFGHRAGGYALLLRRLRSGYAGGAGEVLRAAVGQPHFGRVVSRLSHIRVAVAVTAWWVLLAAALATASWLPLLGLLVAPLLFLSVRRGSLRLGLFSFAAWNIGTLAFYLGLARRRVHPSTPFTERDLTGPLRAGSWPAEGRVAG